MVRKLKIQSLLTVLIVFILDTCLALNANASAPSCATVFTTRHQPAIAGQKARDLLSEIGLDINKGNKIPTLHSISPEHPDALLEARFGSDFSQNMFPRLIALRADFSVLQHDVGLMLRFEQFESFYNRKKDSLEAMSPQKVRSAFSKELGTSRWYRGLALTPEEYQSVLKFGMPARLLQSNFESDVPLKNQIASDRRGYGWHGLQIPGSETFTHLYNTSSLLNLIGSKFAGFSSNENHLLSVTRYPSVAEAVAFDLKRAYEQHLKVTNKTIYIFELNLPVLDVFSIQDIFDNKISMQYQQSFRDKNEFIMHFGYYNEAGKIQKLSLSLFDPELESEIQYFIGRNEIVGVREVSTPRAWSAGFEQVKTSAKSPGRN